jgi:DME family drug/metabolite transporter
MELPLKVEAAPPDRARTNRGYTIALSGVLLWSTTGILIKYLLDQYPLQPLTLAFWRNVFVTAALALGLWLFRRGALRINARDRRFLFFYGLSLSLMNTLWTFSVDLNGAAVSTVLIYASPGITAIAGRLFFREQLGPIRLIAIAASAIGCVLVAQVYDPGAWNVNAAGIVIAILSAFSFSLYSLMGKAVFTRGINSWSATLCAFAIAAFTLIFTQNGSSLLSLGPHFDGWLILIGLAVIPTLGGFGLYAASLGYLPTSTANLIATLEPVLTTILAFVLLQERLKGIQLVGSALIVSSVVSLRVEER